MIKLDGDYMGIYYYALSFAVFQKCYLINKRIF